MELSWKENRGIQNIWIEDSKRDIIVGRGQILGIWENYIIELYDHSNWLENEEVNPEEEVDADEKGPYILQSEVKKLSRRWGIRRLQEMMYLELYWNCWEKMASE